MKLPLSLEPKGVKPLGEVLTSRQYEVLKALVLRRAELCEYCQQSQSDSLHGVYQYQDAVATLVRVHACCQNCYRSMHLNYASKDGFYEQSVNWLCKVNRLSSSEMLKHVVDSFIEWRDRSQGTWIQDVSLVVNYLKGRL